MKWWWRHWFFSSSGASSFCSFYYPPWKVHYSYGSHKSWKRIKDSCVGKKKKKKRTGLFFKGCKFCSPKWSQMKAEMLWLPADQITCVSKWVLNIMNAALLKSALFSSSYLHFHSYESGIVSHTGVWKTCIIYLMIV